MIKLSTFPLVLSIALMGILSACQATLPNSVRLVVDNDEAASKDSFMECPGGLRGRFEIGNLVVESPIVYPGETYAENQIRSSSAPIGAPTLIEGWCYGEGGEELGYTSVEKRLRAANDNGILVFPAPREPYSTCLESVEARGEAPCIISALLE